MTAKIEFMEYLSDMKREFKSPLKFDCPKCGETTVTHYLQIGNALNCPHCGKVITVPESAVATNEDSNVLYTRKQSKRIQLPEREPTIQQLKRRFKYFYIINIFMIILLVFIFPFIIEFKQIVRSDFFWFIMSMFLLAVSWAVPFYLSFAAMNFWGASIHRKYRFLFAAIGIFFIAVSALSVYLFSDLNTMPTD